MDLILWCKKDEKHGPEVYGERNWQFDRFPEFTVNKTIRILLSNKNWLPAFEKKNYEQYGVVRLCRFDKEENHLRCLIEFEDKSVVDKIISDGHIYINDHRINIEAMSVSDSSPAQTINDSIGQSCNNNDQPSNGNAFNITDLNNDCFLFIFRKLQPWTLWSLANTCVRFNEPAKDTFRLKYKRQLFRFCDVFTNYPIPLHQIEAFLRTFGSAIEKIFIAPHEFDYFNEYRLNDVLLLISGNCPHLKVLDIRKIAVDYTVWNECLPLFGQLESLNLTFANSDMDLVQPTVLPKLTSFKITTKHYMHMQSFLLNDWPLEELSMRTFMDLQEMSQDMSQVTEADWSHFFRLISEHCASVKKLSIRPIVSYYNDDFLIPNVIRFNDLKHLRHLSMNFNLRKVRPLLQKMLQNGIQLEYLEIQRADISKGGADIISQFKTIRTLKLRIHCLYTFNDLIEMVKRMPSLSKLSLCKCDLAQDCLDMILPLVSSGMGLSNLVVILEHGCGQYTDEKFEELLAIVKRRPIQIKLKVEFINLRYGPHTIVHFAEKKSNPDLLTIKAMY